MSAPQVDERALSFIARFGLDAYREFLQAGITKDHFDPEYRNVWGFIVRSHREHGTIPSRPAVTTRYPTLDLPRVTKTDLPTILRDLHLRYKFAEFVRTTNAAYEQLSKNSWEDIDTVLEQSVARYNTLLGSNGGQRLVDLFSEKTSGRIIEEMQSRRDRGAGLPTGIPMLDSVTGGLHPGNMAVIIGRTGQGKTWLNLWLVAHAILAGKKVVLYPLEMSLYETATRLYTIFSALLLPGNALRNFDLTHGLITSSKLKKFLDKVQQQYGGQLLVSDTGSVVDTYTMERISAEIDGVKPDLFWVDYLTLVKSSSGDKGWEAVQQLSQGIKHIAQKNNCVGGCSAQVNRQALTADAGMLPRLEHISFGDSIGHTADIVISLTQRGKFLYWALVKNRHGKELPKQKMIFNPNEGDLREVVPDQRARGGHGGTST